MRSDSLFTAPRTNGFIGGLIAGFIAGLGCLIVCNVALAQSEPAQFEPAQSETTATEPRYRVELLVFRHLNATEEGFTETELRDFSDALDLLTPPEPVGESDAPPKTVEPSRPHATEASAQPGAVVTGDGSQAKNEEEGPLEPAVELVEQQSEAMQHAWRRLRGSAGFRPEQFMAWEQSMTAPFPFIRVHDLEVLKELDPQTGLAVGEAKDGETSGEPVEYNDTTKRPYETTANEDATAIPQPIRFYRIDGSSRLRRTRFLHLELDIEFREPEDTAEPAWAVYKLRQNRQVQTAKYEYFDGPHIAVLALVTRIDAVSTEAQAPEEVLATGPDKVQP